MRGGKGRPTGSYWAAAAAGCFILRNPKAEELGVPTGSAAGSHREPQAQRHAEQGFQADVVFPEQMVRGRVDRTLHQDRGLQDRFWMRAITVQHFYQQRCGCGREVEVDVHVGASVKRKHFRRQDAFACAVCRLNRRKAIPPQERSPRRRIAVESTVAGGLAFYPAFAAAAPAANVELQRIFVHQEAPARRLNVLKIPFPRCFGLREEGLGANLRMMTSSEERTSAEKQSAPRRGHPPGGVASVP